MKNIFLILFLWVSVNALSQVKNNNVRVFNVNLFGAKGDGKLSKDGAITSGSHTLTSATIGFTASDVGKTIKVGGAAASNANLLTTISGFTNSTTVTLTAAAGATVSSADIKYGTDNSTFVQAAINAAGANGGGKVIVPNGIYFFSTEVSSDGNGHNLSTAAHIYMPYYSYYSPQTLVTIEIEGEEMANQYTNIFDTTVGAIDVPYTGTLFWSLSNTTNAIISSADSSISWGNFTYGYLKINNIGFRTQSRINNIDTPGKMTAVDASGITMFSIDNHRIDNESPLQNNAPSSTAYGIKLPVVNNWARVDVGRGIVQHYYVGILCAEHATLYNTTVAGCYKGISIESAQTHDINIGKLQSFWNKYNVYISAKCYLKIVNWDMEDYIGSAISGRRDYWLNNTSDLYEPSNTNSYINVEYHRVVSINGVDERGFTYTISSPSTQVQVQNITGSNWYSDPATNTNYPKVLNQTSNAQQLVAVDHTLTTLNTNGFTNPRYIIEKFPGTSNKSAYIMKSPFFGSGVYFSSDSGDLQMGCLGVTAGSNLGATLGLFSTSNGSVPGNVYIDAGSGTGSVNLRTGSQTLRYTIDVNGNHILNLPSGSPVFRLTNAGSDVNSKFTFNTAGAVTTGALSYFFDNTNGFVFGASNGTREIARAAMLLTNSTNTAASEHSDLSFYTQQTAGAAMVESMRITSDGRIFGTNIHNNANAVTGTTNQFIASGTYTPTLTGVANVSASTAYLCQWIRVGNVVTVSGKVDIDPTTTATLTQLGVSLPIASNIANAQNCAGTIAASAVNEQGSVLGDATNDRAEIDFTPTDVTNQSYYFTFTYTVL